MCIFFLCSITPCFWENKNSNLDVLCSFSFGVFGLIVYLFLGVQTRFFPLVCFRVDCNPAHGATLSDSLFLALVSPSHTLTRPRPLDQGEWTKLLERVRDTEELCRSNQIKCGPHFVLIQVVYAHSNFSLIFALYSLVYTHSNILA